MCSAQFGLIVLLSRALVFIDVGTFYCQYLPHFADLWGNTLYSRIKCLLGVDGGRRKYSEIDKMVWKIIF